MLNNIMVFRNKELMDCKLTCVIDRNKRPYFLVSDIFKTLFNLTRIHDSNIKLFKEVIDSTHLIWVDVATSKNIGFGNGYYLITKTGLFNLLRKYEKRIEIAHQYNKWVNAVVFPSIDKAMYERKHFNRY